VWAVGCHVTALDRAPVAEDFGYLLNSSATDIGGPIPYRIATPVDF